MSTVLWFITGMFIGRLLFGNRHAESDKDKRKDGV